MALLSLTGVLALGGCADAGNGDWDWATSSAVLGLSPADLEARLGKPTITTVPTGAPANDLIYKIGQCSVVFNLKESRVWRVHVPLDQPCSPGLGGLDALKDVHLRAGMRYADMPASLTGTWRSNCLAPFCQAGSIISFVSIGDAPERRPDITLETQLVTKAELAVQNAWAKAVIGRSDVYSAELTRMGICGTANQGQATPILNGLKITALNFGYDIDEAKIAGCSSPNAPVSIRGSGNGERLEPAKAADADAGANPATGFGREQIIGGWVPKGESCESDVGIGYDRRGTWATLDESGTWTLEGDRLTMITTERGSGDGGEWEKLSPVERSLATVTRLTRQEMVQKFPDQTIDLVHCP